MIQGPGLLPQSGEKAKKLVVILHGYGSNGEDLLSLAPYWSEMMPETEFLAPNGPEVCESFPLGYQWFGLKAFIPMFVREGLDAVRPMLKKYLLEELEKRSLTPADLAVVGFSQGAMVALDLMYTLPGLSGIIGYSGGFYPSTESPIKAPHPEVLLVHGDMDMAVPYGFFMDAQKQLKNLGVHPQTLTCFGLGHSIDEEGLRVGLKFLKEVFEQEEHVIYMKQ